jgi:hypothetical protein
LLHSLIFQLLQGISVSIFRTIVALSMALAIITTQALATDLPGATYRTATDKNGLTFTIAPFTGWVPGMKGTVGVFGAQASVNVTPIDILKNIGDLVDALDGIYIGSGEVRYGKLGFLYDIYFMKASLTRDIDGNFISGGLELGFQQSTTTLAGTYRVMQTSTSHVDAIAGVRIWDVRVDLGVDINDHSKFTSDGDRWVDGIVGVKGRTAIAPNVSLSGWAMIGAGGSDLTWDLFGGVNYEVRKGFDLSLGFRGMSTDYSKDTFTWDVVQYGPVLGATLKF